MRALIAVCVFILAGCVTDPPREPITVTQVVEVPVEVKCAISYPKQPSESITDVPTSAKGYDKAKAALIELERQRWYAKELRAALTKCAKDQEKP